MHKEYIIISIFIHILIKEVIVLNQNMDMAKLMAMLSKMDPKDLQAGLAKANQLLNSDQKDQIIRELQKRQK